MTSEAQITANRANALFATGPATAAGKAVSSRNSLTLGLYTLHDYVRPEEAEEYAALCEKFQTDLSPRQIAEETLVVEIISAAWKLRRCAKAAAVLAGRHTVDPLLSDQENAAQSQQSIDRAHTRAHNILLRTMAELRRLQTSRATKEEILQPPDLDAGQQGIADTRQVIEGVAADERRKILRDKNRSNQIVSELMIPMPAEGARRAAAELASFCSAGVPSVEIHAEIRKEIARNGPCPCGSGAKYKRCCGKDAPPVLGKAA